MGPPRGPPPSHRSNMPQPDSRSSMAMLSTPPSLGKGHQGRPPPRSSPVSVDSSGSDINVRMKQRPPHVPPKPNPTLQHQQGAGESDSGKDGQGSMLYYADNSWIKVYCTMDGQLLYIDDEEVDIATCTVSNCSAEEDSRLFY